jgi:DNA-binding beta-propeller fold protein YncE
MKKLLLLALVPMLLLAQVEVDTVVHLPSFVMNGWFIPELNKLYVLGWYEHYALDCSSYQLTARIPRSYETGYGHYSWAWRRQKLYVGVNPAPDSLVVIDAVADTLIRAIPWYGDASAYVASTDRLYRSVGHNLVAIDCATDTVVRTIPPPESAYVFSHPAWDSVGNKLYVSLGSWVLQSKVAVYDCATDSLLALIDVPGSGGAAGCMNFDQTLRKAYFASNNPWVAYAGVIDTKRDTLIKLFPIHTSSPYNQVAVDTKNHRVYIAGRDTISGTTVGALYVIDCATDSIVEELTFPLTPWPVDLIRWIPWSNRVYMTRTNGQDSLGMMVVDCNTDSIIVPDLVLGYYSPADFQLDPIRERVFAIGCESTSVHVLRDVEGGVVEEPASARPALASGLQVQPTSAGSEVSYSIASPCFVDLSVYDLMGREVRQLVAEQQPAGEHRALWDGRDKNRASVARGVYFVRLDTSAFTDVKKAVVTR